MRALAALALTLLTAAPAVAQHRDPREPETGIQAAQHPASRIAVQTPRARAPAHAPYTLDTPILTLMDDPRTLAFLDKHLPGLSERMRDEEVATVFGNSSIADMSKDPDHGAAVLTPQVMEKLAKLLADAQAEPKPAS